MRLALLALLLAGCAHGDLVWCESYCARRLYATRSLAHIDVGYCGCERAPDVDWVPKESSRD